MQEMQQKHRLPGKLNHFRETRTTSTKASRPKRNQEMQNTPKLIITSIHSPLH